MSNGVTWTKQDINLLVESVRTNGCISEIAATLNRTPLAVSAKAARLGLKPKAMADT